MTSPTDAAPGMGHATRPKLGRDVLITALAPSIWGSTYIVTTQFLPPDHPLTIAALRALPAGLFLLLIVRTLPSGIWIGRSLVLGGLNFSVFWAMLFISAFRLPGGVAATISAMQPLMVIGLARLLLGRPLRAMAILAALGGMVGVALLVLTPAARLDPIGVAAGFGAALSMALGTVLSRRWQPPVSPVTFTAWQLTAGGLLLLPAVAFFEPQVPRLDLPAIGALAWLSIVGSALGCMLWFRGIARIGPSAAASLGFLSPTVAVTLGWLLLHQTLTLTQIIGIAMVLTSIWFGQRAERG